MLSGCKANKEVGCDGRQPRFVSSQATPANAAAPRTSRLPPQPCPKEEGAGFVLPPPRTLLQRVLEQDTQLEGQELSCCSRMRCCCVAPPTAAAMGAPEMTARLLDNTMQTQATSADPPKAGRSMAPLLMEGWLLAQHSRFLQGGHHQLCVGQGNAALSMGSMNRSRVTTHNTPAGCAAVMHVCIGLLSHGQLLARGLCRRAAMPKDAFCSASRHGVKATSKHTSAHSQWGVALKGRAEAMMGSAGLQQDMLHVDEERTRPTGLAPAQVCGPGERHTAGSQALLHALPSSRRPI